MKEFKESLSLAMPLDAAFDLVFNDNRVLEFMHSKNGFDATPWDKNKRVVKFTLPHDDMPPLLINIVAGGKLSVTTKQVIKHRDAKQIRVDNKVRPHVLGAEFVKIRPTFTLVEKEDKTTQFDIHCKLCAIMPPPLNSIMEGFMLVASKANYAWFTDALKAAM